MCLFLGICKKCRDHLLETEEDDDGSLLGTIENQCTETCIAEIPSKRIRKVQCYKSLVVRKQDNNKSV